jgi:hypothetical protein
MGTIRLFVAKHLRNTVYSNVWISFCAFTWLWQSEVVLGQSSDWVLPLFAGFSTLFLYNFQRILKLQRRQQNTESKRNRWILIHAPFLWAWTIIGSVGTFFAAFYLKMSDVCILLAPTAFSLLYIAKIFKVNGKRVAGRQLPHAKIWIIAFSWAALGALFPVNHFGETGDVLTLESLTWFLEKLFFFVAITIPFDLRDLKYDPEHMKTIPQVMGERKSLRMGQLMILLSVICALALYQINFYSLPILIALVVVYLIVAVLVGMTNEKRSELWYGGVLDGTILLQSSVVIFLS